MLQRQYCDLCCACGRNVTLVEEVLWEGAPAPKSLLVTTPGLLCTGVKEKMADPLQEEDVLQGCHGTSQGSAFAFWAL